MRELLFTSQRVLLPSGMAPAGVRVADGQIIAIEAPGTSPRGASRIDIGDAVLMPGLVDTHVHVNEPGRSDWEGFSSATRAAAAGGITTLLDMPLNAIPATTTAAALGTKREAARGQCSVDVGFIGGVVPGNEADLAGLYEAGVLAWKCFLVDSGVPEFPAVQEATLRHCMGRIAGWGLPLMVHAELPQPIAAARRAGVVRCYADYASTRPVRAESDAVGLMIRLAQEFAAAVHIVHVSSDDALRLIRGARAQGVLISAETCPHYLTFAAEEVPDGATPFKCAPPIRSSGHREALWNGLNEGTLDLVVSDHSPSPAALKHLDSGDLSAAWGGIASLQLGLSAVWTGARRRGLSLSRVVDWMARRPAELVRLGRKGAIAPGYDADLVVFHPDAEWTVHARQLEHRHPVTPYDGLTLAGRVRATYLRGSLIYQDGAFPGPPAGRLLQRQNG